MEEIKTGEGKLRLELHIKDTTLESNSEDYELSIFKVLLK